MTARLLMITLFAASAALAGCGKTGLLEQPAPLFGAQAKSEYATRKQEEADAKARAAAAKKAEPQSPIVDDPNARPLSQAPYGAPQSDHSSNPFAPSPQGSLPSPGATPDR
jgi:predicted small lipoprotein YifL